MNTRFKATVTIHGEAHVLCKNGKAYLPILEKDVHTPHPFVSEDEAEETAKKLRRDRNLDTDETFKVIVTEFVPDTPFRDPLVAHAEHDDRMVLLT